MPGNATSLALLPMGMRERNRPPWASEMRKIAATSPTRWEMHYLPSTLGRDVRSERRSSHYDISHPHSRFHTNGGEYRMSRGERISTSDSLIPNQVRYQAALRPDVGMPTRQQRFALLPLPNVRPRFAAGGHGGECGRMSARGDTQRT